VDLFKEIIPEDQINERNENYKHSDRHTKERIIAATVTSLLTGFVSQNLSHCHDRRKFEGFE
jgi:predicted O-linked N-acetylglucosamine transferase (SPINDLY family)